MVQTLTRTRTLWILFAVFVVETLAFGIVMAVWDFTIIDEMYDPDKIREHIAAMSDVQRTAHAWMTATLDVVYPLTYGALFTGMALRTFKPFYAFPALVVIPTDLSEGFIQVQAMLGNESLIWLKAYVTPAKLVLFTTAILITLAALVVEVRARRKS